VLGTAGAAAQNAPPAYGGGLFATNGSGYRPSVGVSIEHRGQRAGVWWDTSLRCGRDVYFINGHKVVPAVGVHAEATGHGSVPLGRGRVRYSWKLTVDMGQSDAAGVFVIHGKRRGRESCNRKPTRPFQTLLASEPAGTPVVPPPGSVYLGLSDNRANGLRTPVMVRTKSGGKRVEARWSTSARCRRGPREPLVNYTPPTVIRSDGSFSRGERFSVVFSDVIVRYRVLFRGHFTSDGAVGDLRMRARIYGPKGKRLLTRCDTGLKHWTAIGPASPGSGA
jgi:hypothetical protein